MSLAKLITHMKGLVQEKGFEPSIPFGRRILSPLHMPNSATPAYLGASDQTRTGTVLLPSDFESLVSANSTTEANGARSGSRTLLNHD